MDHEPMNRHGQNPVTRRGRQITLSLACAPPPAPIGDGRGGWFARRAGSASPLPPAGGDARLHRDANRVFRFRVLVVLNFLGAALAGYSVLQAGVPGPLLDWPAESLVGFAYVANLFYLLASRRLRLSAVAGLAITAIGILRVATEAGALALLWLYALPPLSFLLLGLRAGIVFNAVLLLATAAFFLLDTTGAILFGRTGLEVLSGYVVVASLTCVSEIRNRRHFRVLEEQSVTDALTGALNRRRYRELIELEIRRAQRHGKGPAVVICDIDRFKRINDRFGHQAGDDVLRHVVHVVRAHVRRTDSLVRLGGDEFLIVAPETTAGAALWMAEKVRSALKQGRVRGLSVTVCMGVAQWQRGEDVAVLLARADRALYRAKTGGRDRVACDSTELSGRVEVRRTVPHGGAREKP